jgi:UDPglucose--hexose-1-phosphate uridylyltransferase
VKTYIDAFLTYGLDRNIITHFDRAKRKLYTLFNLPDQPYEKNVIPINDILEYLLDASYKKGFFHPNTTLERDAYEAYLFDLIMPSPSTVKKTFDDYAKIDKEKAFSYLYELSKNVNYIKTKRINQNIHFLHQSSYGPLQITINLSKPEKDPKDIAKALEEKTDPKDGPKCVLCKENEQNYHNARMNLRIVPITLSSKLWHFQYSPYLYFNEHSIILSDVHEDMKICESTFTALFDFIDFMPTYFIGSNADLPIVGGSILNHDHYQSGRHHFPIEDAKPIKIYGDIKGLSISHLYWPLSTIRLQSKDRYKIEKLATHILSSWKTYENKDLDIIAYTTKLHQTITPIARFKNNQYELDLILRNNRTTKTYPDGIFHPHQIYHHIKKENIGLIEAAGLAILPGRLKDELEHAYLYLTTDKTHPSIDKHMIWLNTLKQKNTITSKDDLYQEVGKIFTHVLEDSGVFKLDASGIKACDHFIKNLIQSYKKM